MVVIVVCKIIVYIEGSEVSEIEMYLVKFYLIICDLIKKVWFFIMKCC